MNLREHDNRIITADAFDALPELPAESVHAVVTDPPYGLAFMGRDWDDFEPKEYQEWCERWASEAKRVLKPGGHLLAFSGNRTHHRLFTGVEDAGFEIRDTLTWHYGSGFPKASDISKTIDKREDAEREVVGVEDTRSRFDNSDRGNLDKGKLSELAEIPGDTRKVEITEPATEQAKKWDGWKTGLKPATEFVVMARKPFDGATVDSVLEHGTGALNIDGTRIGTEEMHVIVDDKRDGLVGGDYNEPVDEYHIEGRYPANVIFDETEAERLDQEVGELHESTKSTRGNGAIWDNAEGETGQKIAFGDSGGPSRYFYTSKATKAERTLDGKIDNAHPTVKPQDLMEWLVKLVTKENQIVLDPFAGSGTTLMAAKNLNRQFIGIEKQAKWADVARVRVGLTPNDPSVVRDDPKQNGMEAYTDGGTQ